MLWVLTVYTESKKPNKKKKKNQREKLYPDFDPSTLLVII